MTGVMITLLIVLSLCLLSVAWVALRRPVVFKMGVRNIPRRRAQSTLIIVGLMLSTLIIGAALGTGDTIDYSMKSEVFDTYGQIDQLVVASHDVAADATMAGGSSIDASALGIVERALSDEANVNGVMPVLETRMPAQHDAASLAEPDVTLVGLDPARLEQFGGIRSTSGGTIDLATLEAGQVVISAKLANAIDAGIGDTISVFYNNEVHSLTVAGIGENSLLTGVRRNVSTGVEATGLAMPVEHLQELTGQADLYSFVAISHVGSARESVKLTDEVSEVLQPHLEGTGLGVAGIKQAGVAEADEFATIFTAVFMVLGLFSVAAGVLLIVLIFTMLAAERRPEMGMARAVGTHRSQLVQQFIAEGSGYAVLAGLIGAAMGVAATYGIALGLQSIFGEYVSIEAHVTGRSLVIAYCLGVVITFLTVVGSSWKISRVNIVSAVRDIPDVVETRRKKSGIIWGGLLLVVGALLTMSGLGGEQSFPFYTGMSLLPFGVALIGRFFGVSSRLLFSLAGLYLVIFWLLPESVSKSLFGNLSGGMEMFFLSGIFMVIGATMVIVNNTDLLLSGISSLGVVFKSKLPAIRTAVAYPGATKGRTGMTIAMFSLIIFSLVMMATMNQNFVALFTGDDATAGWDVRADSLNANPVDDFAAALRAQGVDTSDFSTLAITTSPSESFSQVREAGSVDWKGWPVIGMDETFIQESTLYFERRATGYESDEAVVNALLTESNVAVVDSWVVPSEGSFGSSDQLLLDALKGDGKTFEPVSVEVVDPRSGVVSTIRIIGVIDGKIGSLWGIYAPQATIDAAYSSTSLTSYFVALGNADASGDVAKSIESALLHNGVQATSIRDQIKEQQQQETGFLYIIQGFMGLGLLVGIAAVGVISFRSVVERRQQIGVLRSLGFQREMVSQSFMIETAFVVGMGILSGTLLGLMLSRNLLMSDEMSSSEFTSFLIPWEIIAVVVVGTMLVALLMTWIPARQATRIAPAEALRYE
jgi:putative ABC transport system permease protein